MSSVRVTPLAEGRYGVEGTVTTHHKVAVPADALEDAGIVGADPAAAARETIGFLLDRRPVTAIWPDFPLDQVGQHYPECWDELRRRLSP